MSILLDETLASLTPASLHPQTCSIPDPATGSPRRVTLEAGVWQALEETARAYAVSREAFCRAALAAFPGLGPATAISAFLGRALMRFCRG